MQTEGTATLEERLRSARSGSQEALGQLLEAYRPYLLPRAEQALPAELQAKVGASDLLQDTFTEAWQGFPQFNGSTEAELIVWLQRILEHNAANLVQRYRTSKRQVDREVSLDQPLPGGA